jgi:hypothetical protein
MKGKTALLRQKLLKRAEKFGRLDLQGMSDKDKSLSANMYIGRLIHDVNEFGYLALKEALGHRATNLNATCSELARQSMLDDNLAVNGNAIVTPDAFLRIDRKKISYADAVSNLPALMMYFAAPQVELYRAFQREPLGPELMEWLSIGESGTYEFELLRKQSPQRFAELTRLVYTDKLGKRAQNLTCLSPLIMAFGVTNLQYYLECKVDNIDAQDVIWGRLHTFLTAVGFESGGADYWANHLQDYAYYPYPQLWKKNTLPMHAQEFLGVEEGIDELEIVTRQPAWCKSAIAYYTSNRFFGGLSPRAPNDFEYFGAYIGKLKKEGVLDDYLRTSGMMEIVMHTPKTASPWAKRIEDLFKKHLLTGVIPEITHPLVHYVLYKHTPTNDFACRAYFNLATNRKTGATRSRDTLKKLHHSNPEWLANKIDAYMHDNPLASSCKKLFPFMADPNAYMEILPPQLRVELLESDLGL